MPDFDDQWKFLMETKYLPENNYECDNEIVREFLDLTGIKPWYKRSSFVKDKICLDAGCGPGRWTCALQRLGAARVDSFDISPDAVEICKKN